MSKVRLRHVGSGELEMWGRCRWRTKPHGLNLSHCNANRLMKFSKPHYTSNANARLRQVGSGELEMWASSRCSAKYHELDLLRSYANRLTKFSETQNSPKLQRKLPAFRFWELDMSPWSRHRDNPHERKNSSGAQGRISALQILIATRIDLRVWFRDGRSWGPRKR